MKNRTDIGSIMAIALFGLCIVAGCVMNKPHTYLTTEEKWEKFYECSKNEGDAGCEECYVKIFGHPSGF